MIILCTFIDKPLFVWRVGDWHRDILGLVFLKLVLHDLIHVNETLGVVLVRT